MFVVFSVLFFSMFATGVSAFTGGGDGSSGNPYQITNCVELQEMNTNLNAYYILINDIDCSDTVNWNSEAGFVPLGTFTGIFDGQEYKITGLFINRPSTDYVGLFGFTGSGAIIKNVGLVDVKITGRDYVGGLVGYNPGGTITNSYATGSVTGGNLVIILVGGLVGQSSGPITNSYWNTETSGQSTSAGGTGKTTVEMMQQSTYETWDFVNIWAIKRVCHT